MASFNIKRSDCLVCFDDPCHKLVCDGHKLYFFAMASHTKRTKFTAEEVLVQMENENEFDSDHRGTLTGEKSNMDRKLMDFDEESR